MTMDDALRSELDYKRTSFAREQQPDAGIAGIDTGPAVSPAGQQAPVGDWNYEPQPDQSWKMYPPGIAAPVSAVQGTMASMAEPDHLSGLAERLASGPWQEEPPPASGPNVPPTPRPSPYGDENLAPGSAMTPPSGPFSAEEMNRYLNISRRSAELARAGEPALPDSDMREYTGYQTRLAQQPQDMARALQIHARDNQLRAAGLPGVPLADQIELQQYYDRQGIPTPRALEANERSRYDQILARNAQLAAAGQPGVDLLDMAELRRYQAMLGLARTLPEGYTLPDQTGPVPDVPGVPVMGQPHV